MKAILFILLAIAVSTFAAKDDFERAERPQQMRLPVRRIREDKSKIFDEEDLDTPLSARPPKYTKDGYAINYNLACSSRRCFCEMSCVRWSPCNCMCPPPCPIVEETTTPPPDPTPPPPICINGAPDEFYPDCCFNGGHGPFCCRNGAENRYCCVNGEDNPWCGPVVTDGPVFVTPAPTVGTPAPSPPSNDCARCVCQPCIPWTPCPPCPCQQRCGGGWGK